MNLYQYGANSPLGRLDPLGTDDYTEDWELEEGWELVNSAGGPRTSEYASNWWIQTRNGSQRTITLMMRKHEWDIRNYPGQWTESQVLSYENQGGLMPDAECQACWKVYRTYDTTFPNSTIVTARVFGFIDILDPGNSGLSDFLGGLSLGGSIAGLPIGGAPGVAISSVSLVAGLGASATAPMPGIQRAYVSPVEFSCVTVDPSQKDPTVITTRHVQRLHDGECTPQDYDTHPYKTSYSYYELSGGQSHPLAGNVVLGNPEELNIY